MSPNAKPAHGWRGIHADMGCVGKPEVSASVHHVSMGGTARRGVGGGYAAGTMARRAR